MKIIIEEENEGYTFSRETKERMSPDEALNTAINFLSFCYGSKTIKEIIVEEYISHENSSSLVNI